MNNPVGGREVSAKDLKLFNPAQCQYFEQKAIGEGLKIDNRG